MTKCFDCRVKFKNDGDWGRPHKQYQPTKLKAADAMAAQLGLGQAVRSDSQVFTVKDAGGEIVLIQVKAHSDRAHPEAL